MEDNKIVFSLIAPAIRKNLYRLFYNHIKMSKVGFEIIFVGNNPPDNNIADNFKYIFSEVNPVQCLEIAARNATGEYLICMADDYVFPDRFLDKMYFYMSKLHMEKVLVGNRLQTNGVFYDNILTFERKCINSPVISWLPALKRSVWNDLGGLDRRFLGSLCDVDMIMRFYEIGYSPFVIPDNWANEIRNSEVVSTLSKQTDGISRMLCNKLWVDGNVVVKNRKEPVFSYSDENILTQDQFCQG